MPPGWPIIGKDGYAGNGKDWISSICEMENTGDEKLQWDALSKAKLKNDIVQMIFLLSIILPRIVPNWITI